MKVLKKKKLVDEGGKTRHNLPVRLCMLTRVAEVEHTRTEKNILINNNHPFLVNLKFAFQTDKKIYFVLGMLRYLSTALKDYTHNFNQTTSTAENYSTILKRPGASTKNMFDPQMVDVKFGRAINLSHRYGFMQRR